MPKPLIVIGAVVSDHDSSVALLRDGKLVAAINEERLCRARRGDPRNSVRRALNYVLAAAGVTLHDVDLLACDTTYYYPPAGHPPIAVFPDFPYPEKIIQFDHHLGHVASAFLPSPFDEAAVLSVDASGGIAPLTRDRSRWGVMAHEVAFRDRGFLVAHRHPTVEELLRQAPDAEARNYPAESLSLAHCVRGEVLVEVENLMASGSLGYFYALCGHFLGMEEGSFMGLSSHGGPSEFVGLFEQILRLEDNGRLAIDPEWLLFWAGDRVLDDPVSFRRMSPRWFEAFGQPRDPHGEITQRDKDFAWAAQKRLEQAMVHVGRHLYEVTQSPNLCIAGGVGLNSVANQVVLRETPFENVFIQPAASDDGLALGYALFADYVLAELPAQKRWTMTSAATGRAYDEQEIASFFAHLQRGELALEYFAAIPFTEAVAAIWSVDGGPEQRTPLHYDDAARRWRCVLPAPVGARVEYRFESVGAPIETYCWRPAPEQPRCDVRATPPPEQPPVDPFKKFLDDHRDLAGILDGERAFVGPEHVVIDPTNRCNNNCLPCWTKSPLLGEAGPEPEWHRQQMPDDMLLGLIDELAAMGAKRVRFTGGGEPLLHPAIYEAVEAVKRHGMICAMTTNFAAINEQGVRRLAALGVDELTVSLWAGTPTTYSRAHPNKTEATFERIEAHLRLFNSIKPPTSEVILANVLFAMNFMETREMLDFALRAGADGMYFTLVDSVHLRLDSLLITPPHLTIMRDHLQQVGERVEGLRGQGRAFRIDNWDGFLRRLDSVGFERGDYDIEAVEAIPCYMGWHFIRVLPDGDIAPCCRGVDKPMGNLHRASFKEIWHSDKYREFRRLALNESKRHPYFRPIACHRTCDNLMHNEMMHARLARLTDAERKQLLRYIVGKKI
ncbi:MAG TPA: carbamoyltransferase N-terminal domain-containing protein [bacterium]|nr:carbamoyltransferase N-terminal domain-containing protein [bacterium]